MTEMDTLDIVGYLIAFLIFIGLLSMAVYIVRREWKQSERLSTLANRYGWSFQPHPATKRAYRFKGRQGDIAWQLELYRGGRNQLPLTLWVTSDASFPNGPVLIGPNLGDLYTWPNTQEEGFKSTNDPEWQLLSGRSGLGASMFSHPIGLKRLGIDPTGLSPQPVGSNSFQEQFVLLARSYASAQTILSPAIESELLAWPVTREPLGAPLIICDDNGVTVRLGDDQAVQQPELLDQVVRLGLSVADAARL